jgi:hypothetical protein
MDKPIIGYHKDEESDWVAEFTCGHFQHIRHNPPWISRPWVIQGGRKSMLGHKLRCKKCDLNASVDTI